MDYLFDKDFVPDALPDKNLILCPGLGLVPLRTEFMHLSGWASMCFQWTAYLSEECAQYLGIEFWIILPKES